MIYTILFLIGLLGFAVNLMLGLGHGHTGHLGEHDAGHIGNGNGHAGALEHAGHTHGGHADHGGHDNHNGQGESTRSISPFWSILSPLTLMSLCLGAGATGLILQSRHLPEMMTAIAAAIGGVAFYTFVVRPVFSLAYKFVSQPSKALEGTMAKTAEAASRFDASGRGVVMLNVDGQLVRVLAELEAEDRPSADMIKPGDALTVTAVDGRANTCRVARL